MKCAQCNKDGKIVTSIDSTNWAVKLIFCSNECSNEYCKTHKEDFNEKT